MKFRALYILIILLFVIEIAFLIFLAAHEPWQRQSIVDANGILQYVTKNWGNLNDSDIESNAQYAVIDMDGELLFATSEGISLTVNDAIANRDTILNVSVGGEIVGQVILSNNVFGEFSALKSNMITIFAGIMAVQGLVLIAYILYIKKVLIKPFAKMKSFAIRVAGGDLDFKAEMDRRNLFGAFTESFDIMREELKKAREAEAAANDSKKELVAKLSHDIKTPAASIKAVSELGAITASTQKERKSFEIIMSKADRIDELVSNLFTATLEELKQLTVNACDHPLSELIVMLADSDYLKRIRLRGETGCLLRFDRLRMQQVLDNIISNSYKYAGTEIEVAFNLCGSYLQMEIADFGGGVSHDDLALLTEKFKRGSNANGHDGAGLGLYISKYLMHRMDGDLEVDNTETGFKVTLKVRLSGK